MNNRKKINTLDELLIQEIMDLYSAEKQLIKALPKMVKAAHSQELCAALEGHLEKTKEQANRLEEVFDELNMKPKQKECKAMKGLIQEGEEIIKETEKGMTRDAGIIGAAQRVEHYEIAGYGTASCHSDFLGYDRVTRLLEDTLDQEKEADETLTSIAESFINEEAMHPETV